MEYSELYKWDTILEDVLEKEAFQLEKEFFNLGIKTRIEKHSDEKYKVLLPLKYAYIGRAYVADKDIQVVGLKNDGFLSFDSDKMDIEEYKNKRDVIRNGYKGRGCTLRRCGLPLTLFMVVLVIIKLIMG